MSKVNGYMVVACAAIVLYMLTGCASIGLAPATSFDERLAYAVSQNAAVRTAAARSLAAGDIKKEDAQSVLKITDEARTLMDAAKLAAGVGDLSTAEARLSLATTLLLKLQQHLRERSA